MRCLLALKDLNGLQKWYLQESDEQRRLLMIALSRRPRLFLMLCTRYVRWAKSDVQGNCFAANLFLLQSSTERRWRSSQPFVLR